jgi:hypothetical protein
MGTGRTEIQGTNESSAEFWKMGSVENGVRVQNLTEIVWVRCHILIFYRILTGIIGIDGRGRSEKCCYERPDSNPT